MPRAKTGTTLFNVNKFPGYDRRLERESTAAGEALGKSSPDAHDPPSGALRNPHARTPASPWRVRNTQDRSSRRRDMTGTGKIRVENSEKEACFLERTRKTAKFPARWRVAHLRRSGERPTCARRESFRSPGDGKVQFQRGTSQFLAFGTWFRELVPGRNSISGRVNLLFRPMKKGNAAAGPDRRPGCPLLFRCRWICAFSVKSRTRRLSR